MKRAKVTADHFEVASGASVRIPVREMFTGPAVAVAPSLSTNATMTVYAGMVASDERRDPAHSHLRELMDAKRALDNAIHAERLRLQR